MRKEETERERETAVCFHVIDAILGCQFSRKYGAADRGGVGL